MSQQEDQNRMLRDAVTTFAARDTSIARVRELRDSAPGFDKAVWKTIAELGWTGIMIPEEYGGMGLGLSEMAAVLEEFAKTLSPEPLNPSAVLAARALLHGSNEALKKKLLPGIASGEILPALAWQESEGGIDPLALATRAEGGGLNGGKRFVFPADADGYLVSAQSGNGPVLYWVEKGTAGLTVEYESRADGTRCGRITLRNAKVSDSQLAASGKTAGAALQRAVDEATLMAGAELLGVMSRALEITLEYMRIRVQFGKPIGSFQALQHRAVDLFIQKELSFSVLRDALLHLAADPSGLSLWASRVKYRCSEAGMRIGRESIQIHGGIGFTDECDIGLYMKRAMVLSAWLGNGATHRHRYAALAPAEAAA